MQSRGDVHGLPLVGKGTQSDKCWGKGWEAESTLRATHQLWSREHSVPAPPAVSYYKPRPGGLWSAWDRSYQEIVKKKKCHCFVSTFISTVTWKYMPWARTFMSAYNCISITPKAAFQHHRRMKSLIWAQYWGYTSYPGTSALCVILCLTWTLANLSVMQTGCALQLTSRA